MRKSFSSRLVAWFLMLSLLVSCWGKEPIDPTPPTPPTPTVDTKAPVISVSLSSVNVIGGQEVTLWTSDLKIGTKTVATWKDDVSKTCKAGLEFDGKAISSGTKLSEPGKLKLSVTDEAGNTASADITLTNEDSQAPQISVVISEKNVIAGVKVSIQDNQLLFDDAVAASWTDDYSTAFSVELSLLVDGASPKVINSGDVLLEAGKLTLSVADEFQNKATGEINLTAIAVFGLDNLADLQLQVDQEANLLEGLIIADGLTLQKVEMVQGDVRAVIDNPNSVTFEYPCSIDVILTVAKADGSEIEVFVNDLTVKPLPYNTVSFTNLKPEEIIPVIGQVENGDVNAYDHIDHLKAAEATRIIEMMWKYGTSKYSPEQYQQLMGRLNTGIRAEVPSWYDDYEVIGKRTYQSPSDHAHAEYSVLKTLIKHTKIKLLLHDPQKPNWQQTMLDYINENPNTINIFWSSTASTCDNKELYDEWMENDIIELCNSKQFILFSAGTNLESVDGYLKNKIYNGDYQLDREGGLYCMISSLANSDKYTKPGAHLLVTVGTNAAGDIDQTKEEEIRGSKFPVWFAHNTLFSWRTFPFHSSIVWCYATENWKYATSITNYVNVAMTDLCFQLFAEVADVDQLLEMIRATCLTDHIHLDLNEDGDTNDIHDGHPETVPLQLINPAGFFKKYDMPSSLPSAIGMNETIDLEKGYYKGVIFDIPGAEVLIDGQWVAYDSKNKDPILSQNPMNLKWRLNGDLLRKLGYTSSQTIQGQIVTVDDQWNGLRLEVPISIQIK